MAKKHEILLKRIVDYEYRRSNNGKENERIMEMSELGNYPEDNKQNKRNKHKEQMSKETH